LSHSQLALLLGMTVALGPLALDAYLPAFPTIANDLGVSHSDLALTLSAYVGILGLAQLVGGPLSDRYGRHPILLVGLTVFAASAVMISKADSLGSLVLWRIVQGIGGAFCAVSVPAIVRDQVGGQEAARLFGLIGLIMFIAPAAAPFLGALVLIIGNWHDIFLLLAAYAILLAFALRFALFPRLQRRPPVNTPIHAMLTNYLRVLRHQATMRFVGIQALCFSILLLFITHSSFIYQEWYGLSNTMFSILFAANIALMAMLNLINRWFLKKYVSVELLRIQVTLQFLSLVALVTVVGLGGPLWLVATCIILAVGWQGGIIPNNMANALEFFPHIGGTTAALLGATQYTIAGGISALSTTFGGDTLLPIVTSMLICSAGAMALALGAPQAVAPKKGAKA